MHCDPHCRYPQLMSDYELQDHCVRLEAVTPGEFKQAGAGLTIRYGVAESPFGLMFIGSTARGICTLAFVDDASADAALRSLAKTWPNADLVEDERESVKTGLRLFHREARNIGPVFLYVRGTSFQVAVWRALLAIPAGRLTSYSDVARAVGKPRAVRAVGSAIGANPCAFLIPCHRVIRANGEIGGYRWGLTRKQAINAWEAAASDVMLQEC